MTVEVNKTFTRCFVPNGMMFRNRRTSDQLEV